MSIKYKFLDAEQLYFVSFSVVHWMDAFTRNEYKDILLQSLQYCQQHKDLDLYVYCLMTNHVHLIIGSHGRKLEETLRDLKQFTAKRIIQAIEENPHESRKEWILWMFERAEKKTGCNWKYQFW